MQMHLKIVKKGSQLYKTRKIENYSNTIKNNVDNQFIYEIFVNRLATFFPQKICWSGAKVKILARTISSTIEQEFEVEDYSIFVTDPSQLQIYYLYKRGKPRECSLDKTRKYRIYADF